MNIHGLVVRSLSVFSTRFPKICISSELLVRLPSCFNRITLGWCRANAENLKKQYKTLLKWRWFKICLFFIGPPCITPSSHVMKWFKSLTCGDFIYPTKIYILQPIQGTALCKNKFNIPWPGILKIVRNSSLLGHQHTCTDGGSQNMICKIWRWFQKCIILCIYLV